MSTPRIATEAPNETEALVQFLEDQEPNPYISYNDLIAPESIRRWRQDRVERWLNNTGQHFQAIREGDAVNAVAAWSGLPWDSEYFGFPAARIDLLIARGNYAAARWRQQQLVAWALEDCRKASIRHLIARVDCGHLAAMHTLEQAGFELIDGIQTFSMRLCFSASNESAPCADVRIGPLEEWQRDGVVHLAASAYQFDRFHADSALAAGVADQLHAAWLRNSCGGTNGEEVIVASDGRKILGFVTFRIDADLLGHTGVRVATIVLVATAEAARGKGIGTAMTQYAIRRLARQKVHAVHVGTQLRNLVAARLYESVGFRLHGTSLTFRKLL
ncbi:MAG TPA: GNAT family N-acetyltransferase [Bryobacteraceae bacterium]|nr:GNAT family N-acetyltransferase [Bryobacteraceae bacterium]